MKRVRAEIVNARKLGGYRSLTIVSPEIAERARPGQFVAVALPDDRRFLLRRHFAIHQSSRRGGWAGAVEFVLDPRGAGTDWFADMKAHRFLDVIGPLGKPFAYPQRLDRCLLVSEGYGAASMYFLAQELRARGKRVDMIVGAESEEFVFKPIESKRLSQTIEIVTADGSMGRRGAVTDALEAVAGACGSQVIYAAGSRPTLRLVAEFCMDRAIPSQILVGERMACGLGVCYTCVVPVIRKDGTGYDNLRACTDGPVFNPARVLWDRWMGGGPATVPTPPEGFPVVRSWPG